MKIPFIKTEDCKKAYCIFCNLLLEIFNDQSKYGYYIKCNNHSTLYSVYGREYVEYIVYQYDVSYDEYITVHLNIIKDKTDIILNGVERKSIHLNSCIYGATPENIKDKIKTILTFY